MKISDHPTIISISKFISNFFNPFTSLVLYFIYFSYRRYSLLESFYHFLPIFLIIIFPVSFWILYNVKTGKYDNLDVSNRIQRKTLYHFVNGAMFIYLLFDYFVMDRFDIMMFYLLILLLIMQFSNLFIKSSMHTALNFYVAALFFSENSTLGIIWIFVAITVGISRILVKRHSPKEVLMGFILATAVSLPYLYTFNQLIAVSK